MNDPRHLSIEDFTYDLPEDKIAKYPLAVRDRSKLLICKGGQISEDTYSNISAHIPEGSLLVFNKTKVIHARLLFTKPTGGRIEIFCLEPHSQYADVPTGMSQYGKVWWQCMVGGAAKWKHGTSLTLTHQDPDYILSATIVAHEQDSFTIEFTWDNDLSFAEILHHSGKVPLPPYLHRESEPGDDDTYQTIFAKEEGSVAAPTAGLHFTPGIMESLKSNSIDSDFVTLHVGAGTFKPVKAAVMEQHEMHAEWIEIETDTIERLIAHLDKNIVAVGTTSLRTLESIYWIGVKLMQGIAPDPNAIAVNQWDPYELGSDVKPAHALKAVVDWLLQTGKTKLITRTRIIIAPGYQFRVIKGLVTNFHQPRSTLLLLVAALVGADWKNAYEHALQHDFRFLSYGDGCLLWL